MTAIKIVELIYGLNAGGTLEFVNKTCTRTFIDKSGKRYPVDGRAYQAFLQRLPRDEYDERSTGSVEKGNLVITWRAAGGGSKEKAVK